MPNGRTVTAGSAPKMAKWTQTGCRANTSVDQAEQVLAELPQTMRSFRVVLHPLLFGTRVVASNQYDSATLTMRGSKHEMPPSPSEPRVESGRERNQRAVHHERPIREVAGNSNQLAAQIIDDAFRVTLHSWKRQQALWRSRREDDASIRVITGRTHEVAEPPLEEGLFVGFGIQDET